MLTCVLIWTTGVERTAEVAGAKLKPEAVARKRKASRTRESMVSVISTRQRCDESGLGGCDDDRSAENNA